MQSEQHPLITPTKTESQLILPEGLVTLDNIKPLSPEILPESVCVDALVASANFGNEQIGEIIKYEAAHPSEDTNDVPQTFADMLDTASGNVLQRAAKAWIKPRNPEVTIKLMKALQVDHFQQILIQTLALIRRLAHIEKRIQTNYTLGDNSMNSLVDFATNQTTFNEALHLGVMALNAAIVIPGVASGHIDADVAVNLGAMAVNTYCVLAQRYGRARLSIAIDRALRRNKEFDPEKYTNALGIRLPTPSEDSDRQ